MLSLYLTLSKQQNREGSIIIQWLNKIIVGILPDTWHSSYGTVTRVWHIQYTIDKLYPDRQYISSSQYN